MTEVEAPINAKAGTNEQAAQSKFMIMMRLIEADPLLKKMIIDALVEVKLDE